MLTISNIHCSNSSRSSVYGGGCVGKEKKLPVVADVYVCSRKVDLDMLTSTTGSSGR